MLVKNLTSFLYGTKVCSRKPPQPEMTLVVRGTFRLRPGEPLAAVKSPRARGRMRAEAFHPDDDERQGECLYGGDFADFKLNAEVLVQGTCHAPGGKPATECPVLVRVGAWSKMLRVVGPRVWTNKVLGSAVSDPAPFTTMEISYRNAFGGPGWAKNPVGKGIGTDELPNVEHARDVIRSRSDRPEPAGLGPISPFWPQRASKLGSAYGGDYFKTRAPFYAEDLDWTYFHAAPPDQQIQGYLRGDEDLTFQNLHPSVPVLSARLPGIRVRAFVKDVVPTFREIPMVLDTLWARPDRGIVYLTWRGVVPVREDDLTDVKTVLVAQEKLDAERRPEARYQRILEAFEQDPIGLKKKLPPGLKEAAERREKALAGEPVPPAPGGEDLDPAARLVRDRLGALPPDKVATLSEAIKQVRAAHPQVDLDAEIQKTLAQVDDVPPTPLLRKPGAMPVYGLRRAMRAVLAEAAKIKQAVEGKPLSDEQRQQIEALERLPHDPGWRQMDPDYTAPERPVSTDEPGPGRDLSEQDLTGRDLRGLDLSNANLEEAILTRADLRGAKLAGARLRKAILFRADLSGADLTGADLTRANAARVRAEGANFRGAKLDLAFFEDAVLVDAVLVETNGEYAVFKRADLTGAVFQRAKLPRGDFSAAKLDRTDFSWASLVGARFARAHGEGTILTGTNLTRAGFTDAAMSQAKLGDARGNYSIWLRAAIEGADFSYARLQHALFNEASAADANFFGADLKRGRLRRAKLDRAEFKLANLFAADLSKAVLNAVKFNDANLYEANFTKASGAGADFNGANLKRSTLVRR